MTQEETKQAQVDKLWACHKREYGEFPYVPQEVWDELNLRVAELECVDNFRAYRESDGFYEKEFVAAKENGCCGEYEGATIHSGDKWIIGCNHGH